MSLHPVLSGAEWNDASVLLRGFALVGIPIGISLGAALGLIARKEEGWGGYSSFPRRAARLGHVAAVALPLLAGFYALALTAWPHDAALAQTGSGLWIVGSAALVLTLFAGAWKRGIANWLPLPATTVLAGGAVLALSILRGGA